VVVSFLWYLVHWNHYTCFFCTLSKVPNISVPKHLLSSAPSDDSFFRTTLVKCLFSSFLLPLQMTHFFRTTLLNTSGRQPKFFQVPILLYRRISAAIVYIQYLEILTALILKYRRNLRNSKARGAFKRLTVITGSSVNTKK
jgi:hypothetical protein